MPAVTPKKMLETLLKSTLTAKEREAFEGMWDAVHRYGRLSSRQTGWVEEVFYKLTSKAVREPPKHSPKVGFMTSPTATKTLRIRNLKTLGEVLPELAHESAQYMAIERFFKSGGEVFEIRPPKEKKSPQ